MKILRRWLVKGGALLALLSVGAIAQADATWGCIGSINYGSSGGLSIAGSGAPAASIGCVNDTYIDYTNSTIYGPKTLSGWGASHSLGSAGPGGSLPANVQGDIFYSSATNVVSALNKSVSSSRYLANTGTNNNPAWAQVSLTTGVTGTLPSLNGGTESTLFAVTGPTTTKKTYTFPDASTVVLTTAAPVTVAQGGTGLAAVTSGGILYGSSTSTVASSGAMSANCPIIGGGAGASPITDQDFQWDATTNIMLLGTVATPATVKPTDASGATTGAALTIQAGKPGATNIGGALNLRGSVGGATSGAGGAVNLTGGASTSGTGGDVTLTAGNGGTGGLGGQVTVTAGTGAGGGNGGAFVFSAGNGGATGSGGSAGLNGGSGGATSGNGGGVDISAGIPTNGSGGTVTLFASDGAGTNKSGGDLQIGAGLATGSGTAGSVQVIQGGVVLGSPTGGSKGTGTLNATALYVNNVAVGAGASGANPTGTIGLTAVNGAAATFLRSDGAPALSQAIVPIWSASHTFSGAGAAGSETLRISSSNPIVFLKNTGAGADLGNWRVVPTTGALSFSGIDDANSANREFLRANRGSGVAIASVAVGNTTDNPQFNVTGTGRANFSGPIVSVGTKFTASGCSNSATVGGVLAGQFASGTAGACTVTITFATAAPNGYACHASDITTPANLISQSGSVSTTACTITGTTVSGDTIVFSAMGY